MVDWTDTTQIGNATLYLGRCEESLLLMADQSVQCCVTSPPYFGLRDYGVDGQLGLEKTPEKYVAAMVAVFREVRRVLRDDGVLWLNLGDSYAAQRGGTAMPAETLAGGAGGKGDEHAHRGHGATHAHRNAAKIGLKHKDLIGIPWRVAFALQADGWYLRQDIIWHKPNPMPESVTDRCTKAHEYIFMLTKSARYYYDAAAIAEPLSSASIERLIQPTLENQAGSDRVPGKTNGNMHASWNGSSFDRGKTGEMKATRGGTDPKQDGYGNRRMTGFNARYFGSDQPYTGESKKDYADGGAQDASATKARIVDRILAGEITTRNKRSVWTVTTKPFKGAHFATFPRDLVEPCVLAGSKPGDVVLDPFGGSGTTADVSLSLRRRAVYCELNLEYFAMASERINDVQRQGALFVEATA